MTTDNKPAVAERIDLPGGCYWSHQYIRHPYGGIIVDCDRDQALKLAAAMRAEPAAPVPEFEETTNFTDADWKRMVAATPPGDVAMQAAREWLDRHCGTPDMGGARNSACIIRDRLAQLEATQAPAVCQSDEDVARKLLGMGVRVGLEYYPDIHNDAVQMVARHRQVHEATAWQKGCEYMREAAINADSSPFYEEDTSDGYGDGSAMEAMAKEKAIRALPIPPAPTGGCDGE